jgi:uncharacterized protein
VTEATPEEILRKYRVIAMVGASSKPETPSYRVHRYLSGQGYRVIPVNPGVKKVLGKVSYPDLGAVPESIEVVNIFRRPRAVPPIVAAAIKVGAKAVWMQEGIVHEEAARQAREAGLTVVMDKCMRKEHLRMTGRSSEI